MSGRPPAPCRFGWQCHRPDCYFAHPEGRQIDGNPPPGAFPPVAVVPPVFFPAPAQGMIPVAVQPAPFMPAPGPLSPPPGKNPVPCRFDRKCSRADCYYFHPNGREIDDQDDEQAQDAISNAQTEETDGELKELDRALEEAEQEAFALQGGVDEDSWFPTSQGCQCCQGFIYRCGCDGRVCRKCGGEAAAAAAENDDADDSAASDWAPWKDEWFPESRNCTTCNGYKYRVPGKALCPTCSSGAAGAPGGPRS